ncbi:unnamed protein product [Orchesella dallaii]|uniref:CCHC-type domain-containing protein n=1 Tax=Orchesella dallaii TaxID=48710 RepID=A0ABP1R8I0_9HEXA
MEFPTSFGSFYIELASSITPATPSENYESFFFNLCTHWCAAHNPSNLYYKSEILPFLRTCEHNPRDYLNTILTRPQQRKLYLLRSHKVEGSAYCYFCHLYLQKLGFIQLKIDNQVTPITRHSGNYFSDIQNTFLYKPPSYFNGSIFQVTTLQRLPPVPKNKYLQVRPFTRPRINTDYFYNVAQTYSHHVVRTDDWGSYKKSKNTIDDLEDISSDSDGLPILSPQLPSSHNYSKPILRRRRYKAHQSTQTSSYQKPILRNQAIQTDDSLIRNHSTKNSAALSYPVSFPGNVFPSPPGSSKNSFNSSSGNDALIPLPYGDYNLIDFLQPNHNTATSQVSPFSNYKVSTLNVNTGNLPIIQDIPLDLSLPKAVSTRSLPPPPSAHLPSIQLAPYAKPLNKFLTPAQLHILEQAFRYQTRRTSSSATLRGTAFIAKQANLSIQQSPNGSLYGINILPLYLFLANIHSLIHKAVGKAIRFETIHPAGRSATSRNQPLAGPSPGQAPPTTIRSGRPVAPVPPRSKDNHPHRPVSPLVIRREYRIASRPSTASTQYVLHQPCRHLRVTTRGLLSVETRRCYRCHQRGHLARNCQRPCRTHHHV